MNFTQFLRARLLPLASAFAMVVGLTAATNYVLSPVLALSGTVTIGVNGRLPGWSFGSNNLVPLIPENAVGFDVELAKFLERKFGFHLELRRLAPDKRETALLDGDVDLVIANYSYDGYALDGSRRRTEVLDFAGPYYHDVSGIMYSKDKLEKLKLQTIPREGVCVSRGTTAQKDYPDAIVIEQENCFQRFANSTDYGVVAVSTDLSLLTAYTQLNPDRDDDEVGVMPESWKFDPFDNSTRHEYYGIAMRNNSPLLCKQLADAIQEFLNDHENGWDRAFQDSLGLTRLKPGDHKPKSADCQG